MDKLTQPIVLCGFMASGKTATAKAIGGIIHSDFVDLDVQIEFDEGNQPKIFRDHGEDYFRRIERRIMIGSKQNPKNYFLGGGALQNQELDMIKHNLFSYSFDLILSFYLDA